MHGSVDPALFDEDDRWRTVMAMKNYQQPGAAGEFYTANTAKKGIALCKVDCGLVINRRDDPAD